MWGEAGFTHLEQDIRCRPRYANAINADLLVSVHNNGGGGTGTETLYDTNNGFGAESRRLADLVHGKVLAAIRRDYNATWVDRRVQGFNGSYGENRLASRPAVIMEIAFMDRPTPDNAALQDERFKRLVAMAIKEGIEEFLEGPAAPVAPRDLVAGGVAGGVALGWRDLAENEAGFRIERRAAGAATWETLATTRANEVSYFDPTAAEGRTYGYRVAAVNARGASAATGEAEAAALAAGAPPTAWVSNVSLRTTLATGRTVVVGFVVAGGSKEILLRAAGPALRQFGLSAVVAEPRLQLYRGTAVVTENRGWQGDAGAAAQRLGAFPFAAGSADAALLRAVEGGGTVHVSGGTGVVLVEAYDAGSGSAQRLVNLSARNCVGTGGEILIAGFHVNGTGAQRVLVRAVGPGLTGFGVAGALADPRMSVLDTGGATMAENDNWDGGLAGVFGGAGAFSLATGSRDAAAVLTLAAGRGYTVQVSGAAGGTGEALVEIYELP